MAPRKKKGTTRAGGRRGRVTARTTPQKPSRGPRPSSPPARKKTRARSKPARKKTRARSKPATPARSRHTLAPQVKAQLYEAVMLLRKHIHGYEARDGYGLRDIDTFDQRKRHRILQLAAKVRELVNTPHDLVKAKTSKARKSLNLFTGQKIRNAKHYIVHKPGDNFTVSMRDGNVHVEGRFGKRVISNTEYFLFPRRPKYPNELVTMTRALKKGMPPGFYVLLTAAHGDTGEPFERDTIIERLNEYLAAYEVDAAGRPSGFSEALIGFRFMSTTLDGAVVQRRQVDKRRDRQKEHNRKERKKLIKKFGRKPAKKTKRVKRRVLVYILVIYWIDEHGAKREMVMRGLQRTRAVAERRAKRTIALLPVRVRASASYRIMTEYRLI